jgi:hypothetical protein
LSDDREADLCLAAWVAGDGVELGNVVRELGIGPRGRPKGTPRSPGFASSMPFKILDIVYNLVPISINKFPKLVPDQNNTF